MIHLKNNNIQKYSNTPKATPNNEILQILSSLRLLRLRVCIHFWKECDDSRRTHTRNFLLKKYSKVKSHLHSLATNNVQQMKKHKPPENRKTREIYESKKMPKKMKYTRNCQSIKPRFMPSMKQKTSPSPVMR